MADFLADPGGVFDSDTHRRVAGHLSPDEVFDVQALGHRVSSDAHHGLASVADLEGVLADLEGDGYASSSKAGWKLTKKGLDALTAPLPDEPHAAPFPVRLEGLEG